MNCVNHWESHLCFSESILALQNSKRKLPIFTALMKSDHESCPTDKEKILILGGGPNRIGQGIEFDYCCCQAAFALSKMGYETIMYNCNPETVSTDYDTADRLYFEPLTLEHVLNVIDARTTDGRDRTVWRTNSA